MLCQMTLVRTYVLTAVRIFCAPEVDNHKRVAVRGDYHTFTVVQTEYIFVLVTSAVLLLLCVIIVYIYCCTAAAAASQVAKRGRISPGRA